MSDGFFQFCSQVIQELFLSLLAAGNSSLLISKKIISISISMIKFEITFLSRSSAIIGNIESCMSSNFCLSSSEGALLTISSDKCEFVK